MQASRQRNTLIICFSEWNVKPELRTAQVTLSNTAAYYHC